MIPIYQVPVVYECVFGFPVCRIIAENLWLKKKRLKFFSRQTKCEVETGKIEVHMWCSSRMHIKSNKFHLLQSEGQILRDFTTKLYFFPPSKYVYSTYAIFNPYNTLYCQLHQQIKKIRNESKLIKRDMGACGRKQNFTKGRGGNLKIYTNLEADATYVEWTRMKEKKKGIKKY